ncbi:hypothetical protein [Mucilaginibacter sp.]|uniref:hypothetical protein n=1 Tax=Mucilaginibacter sp. TaxID=1882438 RepID=UPI0035BC2C54
MEKGCKCPFCEASVDSHSHKDKIEPKQGDLSVCLYCSALSVFDEHIKLRKPTSEEITSFKSDANLWREIKSYVVATTMVNQPQ